MLLLGGAVISSGCALSEEVLASEVIEAPGASGDGFGDPSHAIDGVRGGGDRAQSLDVYAVPPGAHLVLGWGGRRLVDGPGPDLVVFENPFDYGDLGNRFMDPAVVEVSADGETWVAFAVDYAGPDEGAYSPRPEHWIGFAGVTPVQLHAEEAPMDPLDPAAGGDGFDLATLPDELRDEVRYVRLSAATAWTNPDTGAPFPRDPVSDGIDVDGVAGRVAP